MLKEQIISVIDKQPGISFFNLWYEVYTLSYPDFVAAYQELIKDNKIKLITTKNSSGNILGYFLFPATYTICAVP